MTGPGSTAITEILQGADRAGGVEKLKVGKDQDGDAANG
jgi:hypothetical protein